VPTGRSSTLGGKIVKYPPATTCLPVIGSEHPAVVTQSPSAARAARAPGRAARPFAPSRRPRRGGQIIGAAAPAALDSWTRRRRQPAGSSSARCPSRSQRPPDRRGRRPHRGRVGGGLRGGRGSARPVRRTCSSPTPGRWRISGGAPGGRRSGEIQNRDVAKQDVVLPGWRPELVARSSAGSARGPGSPVISPDTPRRESG